MYSIRFDFVLSVSSLVFKRKMKFSSSSHSLSVPCLVQTSREKNGKSCWKISVCVSRQFRCLLVSNRYINFIWFQIPVPFLNQNVIDCRSWNHKSCGHQANKAWYCDWSQRRSICHSNYYYSKDCQGWIWVGKRVWGWPRNWQEGKSKFLPFIAHEKPTTIMTDFFPVRDNSWW